MIKMMKRMTVVQVLKVMMPTTMTLIDVSWKSVT